MSSNISLITVEVTDLSYFLKKPILKLIGKHVRKHLFVMRLKAQRP